MFDRHPYRPRNAEWRNACRGFARALPLAAIAYAILYVFLLIG